MDRQINGLRRGIRPGARDNGHTPIGGLDAKFGHALVLGMVERGRFAGGAAGNKAVRPLGDLPLDEVLKGLLVNLAFPERGDQRNQRALEHGDAPPFCAHHTRLSHKPPRACVGRAAASGIAGACRGSPSRPSLPFVEGANLPAGRTMRPGTGRGCDEGFPSPGSATASGARHRPAVIGCRPRKPLMRRAPHDRTSRFIPHFGETSSVRTGGRTADRGYAGNRFGPGMRPTIPSSGWESMSRSRRCPMIGCTTGSITTT